MIFKRLHEHQSHTKLQATGSNWLLTETDDSDTLALNYIDRNEAIASVLLYLTYDGWSMMPGSVQGNDTDKDSSDEEISAETKAQKRNMPNRNNLETCIFDVLQKLDDDHKISWRRDTHVWLCPDGEEKSANFSEYAFPKTATKKNAVEFAFNCDNWTHTVSLQNCLLDIRLYKCHIIKNKGNSRKVYAGICTNTMKNIRTELKKLLSKGEQPRLDKALQEHDYYKEIMATLKRRVASIYLELSSAQLTRNRQIIDDYNMAENRRIPYKGEQRKIPDGFIDWCDSYLIYINSNEVNSIENKINDLLRQANSMHAKKNYIYLMDDRQAFHYVLLKDKKIQEQGKLHHKLGKEEGIQTIIQKFKLQYPDIEDSLFKLTIENVNDITSNTNHTLIEQLQIATCKGDRSYQEDRAVITRIEPPHDSWKERILELLVYVLQELALKTYEKFFYESGTQAIGTTASLALVIGGKLYVAWIGDSPIIKIKKTKNDKNKTVCDATFLSSLHRCHKGEEDERVKQAGGIISDPPSNQPNAPARVNQFSMVTRDVGTRCIGGGDGINEIPSVNSCDVEKEDLVMLVSDGFIDHATLEDVRELARITSVAELPAAGCRLAYGCSRDPKKKIKVRDINDIAEDDRNGSDNITVIAFECQNGTLAGLFDGHGKKNGHIIADELKKTLPVAFREIAVKPAPPSVLKEQVPKVTTSEVKLSQSLRSSPISGDSNKRKKLDDIKGSEGNNQRAENLETACKMEM
jgi:serine/threonine protein phosphatase PrpC